MSDRYCGKLGRPFFLKCCPDDEVDYSPRRGTGALEPMV